MTQQENKPIKEFRAGSGISASIWRNEEAQEDGTTRVRHSVKFQKRYCDKNGQWQDSDYYFPDDLPKLQLVVQKAFEFISLKESKEAEEAIPI